MKCSLLIYFLLALFPLPSSGAGNTQQVFDIRKYGAKGDGRTMCTEAINKAVSDCSESGGGVVLVPKGRFVTGTVVLKDNVDLHLDKGAVLEASMNLDDYQSFVPKGDISYYDSGDGSQNANNSKDLRWNRALVLGSGIQNVRISGDGEIDGKHLYDPLGEEKMRGPHTVIIGQSRNFTMEGVTVNNAANYAFMAYDISNCVFSNLSINQGWDGIHIRGGRNIIIRNCSFQTGDDAIAGGYWENMVISDCHINTACNGIRMIMPSNDLEIAHCVFRGPGVYPHRTSRELNRKNMQSAIILQPGGWGKADGDMSSIYIHDIEIDNVTNPLMMVLNESNHADGILVERLKAENVYYAAASLESWRGGVFRNVEFRDIDISYMGSDDPELSKMAVGQPPADSRQLPCWGWYVKNAVNVVFENLKLSYEGEEFRPAIIFDNVADAELVNVSCRPSHSPDDIVKINSGKIVVR